MMKIASIIFLAFSDSLETTSAHGAVEVNSVRFLVLMIGLVLLGGMILILWGLRSRADKDAGL
jgi:hypothetical protein